MTGKTQEDSREHSSWPLVFSCCVFPLSLEWCFLLNSLLQNSLTVGKFRFLLLGEKDNIRLDRLFPLSSISQGKMLLLLKYSEDCSGWSAEIKKEFLLLRLHGKNDWDELFNNTKRGKRHKHTLAVFHTREGVDSIESLEFCRLLFLISVTCYWETVACESL